MGRLLAARCCLLLIAAPLLLLSSSELSAEPVLQVQFQPVSGRVALVSLNPTTGSETGDVNVTLVAPGAGLWEESALALDPASGQAYAGVEIEPSLGDDDILLFQVDLNSQTTSDPCSFPHPAGGSINRARYAFDPVTGTVLQARELDQLPPATFQECIHLRALDPDSQTCDPTSLDVKLFCTTAGDLNQDINDIYLAFDPASRLAFLQFYGDSVDERHIVVDVDTSDVSSQLIDNAGPIAFDAAAQKLLQLQLVDFFSGPIVLRTLDPMTGQPVAGVDVEVFAAGFNDAWLGFDPATRLAFAAVEDNSGFPGDVSLITVDVGAGVVTHNVPIEGPGPLPEPSSLTLLVSGIAAVRILGRARIRK